ncbi:MAG: DUF4040 domain-containing protein [Pseudomonadota bacterium]
MLIQAVPTSPLVSTLLLDVGLLAVLVMVAFAIVRMRSLFAVVMLQGVYSLVAAAWFVTLDAVDVAFTEAAVGAGISTVLMLAAILLAERKASLPVKRSWGPLAVVVIAGAAMLYAVPDLPAYGDVDSPANSYVGNDYLAKTAVEVDVPNVVTAVLASYRGYDTFGETVVIFAAGLGVMLLLGLDGTSGSFRARVMGRQLSDPSAPAGARDEPRTAADIRVVEAPADEAQTLSAARPGSPPSVTRFGEDET